MEDFMRMHSSILAPPSSSFDPTHPSPADADAIKDRIMAHPHYSSLVAAYADCHRIGAPPEVAARLSVFSSNLPSRSVCHKLCTSDPELDQFMEAYCNILVKCREEIARPLEEAADFLRRVETELSTITDGRSTSIFHLSDDCDGNHGAACSANQEDGFDAGNVGEAAFQGEIGAEERELKQKLLRKYSGYLGSLRQELSKKKKKGKLPKEARQKLLGWWELNKQWPYPSEQEKAALVESTGLDQKQINNWFINQRKRHWKPSEEMQFMVFGGYDQQQLQQKFRGDRFVNMPSPDSYHCFR